MKPPAKDKCGELLTSLCYHPSNSILTLTLLKARNLKAKDINGKSGKFFIIRDNLNSSAFKPLRSKESRSRKAIPMAFHHVLQNEIPISNDFLFLLDPYVKVWLQFGDKRIEKRKTAVFKCTLNPVFNDTFSFNVPWEKIRECSLDVMVMDFDNIGRNELIGRILLAGKALLGISKLRLHRYHID